MARPRSLRRREDFARIYDHGHKFVAPSFVLYVLPADDTATAVVASKRIGKAVRRNRAKRLLRELLRLHLLEGDRPAPVLREVLRRRGVLRDEEGEPPGLWIVLVARGAILERKLPAVAAELERVLGSRRES